MNKEAKTEVQETINKVMDKCLDQGIGIAQLVILEYELGLGLKNEQEM